MSDATKKYDLLFKNVKIVRPGQNDVPALDIGVKDGKILAVEAGERNGSDRYRGVVTRSRHKSFMQSNLRRMTIRIFKNRFCLSP